MGRGVVATVAQQADYMKRVRGNGGSRSRLQPEGIVILGDSSAHQKIAQELDIEVPMSGESVAVRVVPAGMDWDGPAFEADDALWRQATLSDPLHRGPNMKNPRVAHPSNQ